jgi:nicotinamidase-related amidase
VREPQDAAEFRIALHPDRLGRGLGRTIAILVLRHGFAEPGIDRIRLIVRKNNPRAERLYLSLGFVRTGECVEEVHGRPVPFFRMEIDRLTFEKGARIMKQALLVIDVQNEYFTGKLPVTYPADSFENILKAMDWAHASRVPVAVIRHTNLAPEAQTFRQGTAGWELHDEIKRRHADILIDKNLPGSFTGTGLARWLGEREITTVTIAGYMTQMCCDTTSRQAFHRGYTVNFLADATGTLSVNNAAGSVTDAELHRAILVTQQMRFARVLKTGEWIMGL